MMVTVLTNRTLIDGVIGGKSVTTWALLKHYIMTGGKKHKQGQGMTFRAQSAQGAAFPQQTPSFPWCLAVMRL